MRLAIVGASGHGKVVAEIAELCGYQAFFFDDAYPALRENGKWQVYGTLNDLIAGTNRFDGYFVSIGNNEIRKKIISQLNELELPVPCLVHPSATVSSLASLNEGTVVMSGASVNPYASIGSGCIINTGVVVEHDCAIGDFCHISPSASLGGGVKVGSMSWIGIGASVKHLVEIGENVIVGVGAAVVSDLASDIVAFGNPARKHREQV